MGNVKETDDRFKKFGTVSFASVTKTADFVGYLEKGEVRGTRCKGCGQVFFPPRADCYKCLSSDMEWFDAGKPGNLVSYSKLEFAPAGFEGDVPYSIALLDCGDHKIFGRISPDVPEDQISVGMKMKAKVNRLPNGQLNYVFEKA
jgi:hypothetical protein